MIDGRQSETALMVQRGTSRFLEEQGMVVLSELPLANGRRADLVAMDRKGMVTIIEIKSSVEDFQVDRKWPEYKAFCDCFAFATAPDVPVEIFPGEEGLMVADGFGAHVIRDPVEERMPPHARKALTLQFARLAARRLDRVIRYSQAEGLVLPEQINDDDEA
jgi:hypothetical protein